MDVSINQKSVRTISEVVIKDINANEIIIYQFPINGNETNKRLLFIKNNSFLSFRFPIYENDFSITSFLLKRVTKNFSHSRLLKKLRSIHPKYKQRQINNHQTKVTKIIDLSQIDSLWLDYCDIFEDASNLVPYFDWIKIFEHEDLKGNRVKNLIPKAPLLSIIMPVYNPNLKWLRCAVDSVIMQSYVRWELCIADDASTDPNVRYLLQKYSNEDNRIKVSFREHNGHISAASNSALALAQGEWVALLDHDDVLADNALFWVAEAIKNNPECRLLYSDEDKIDETGRRSDPYFKSAWNQDLFYSQNMFSHLGVYSTSLLREIGGFKIGLEGSQDYDLALRCIERISVKHIHHIPRVLYHWRIHANSTANGSDVKPYAMAAGTKALNEHFRRTRIAAEAESVGYGYRVKYLLPSTLPLVSLIIPTRNGVDLLRRCVDSILNKTSYGSVEIIIVDNCSDHLATLQYLKKLVLNPLIQVLRDNRPFNYSALNNAAVKVARGEIIGLINNDVEVINADWLSEMVSHALRPGVAAVGARLWYSDDTLQHAGVVLGIHGIAGHVHRFLPRHDVGYCGRASLIQSFSAVTAACLVVRKSIYEELGGLNESELPVACNDVDFCLRAREAGYKNIWTPYAELYHHESASRGFDDTPEKQARSAKEVAYMKQRWGDALLNDPAYSPNLTLDSEDFGLAWPPRVPSLDDVLSAIEQADQASTHSSTPLQ